MHPTVLFELAQARLADLQRAADRHRGVYIRNATAEAGRRGVVSIIALAFVRDRGLIPRARRGLAVGR